MVPFIDVMLVLLIIFMVTAPLITPSVIVDLPSVGKSKQRQPDHDHPDRRRQRRRRRACELKGKDSVCLRHR